MLRDAVIILVAQKIEYYEVAIDETLYAYAMLLAERKVSCMLNQILEDEKRMNANLNALVSAFIDPNTNGIGELFK